MSKIEVSHQIIENFLLDQRKNIVDPYERAIIIREFLKEKNISQRELGRRLNIPHSTVQDWLMWKRLTNIEYNKMRKNGLSTSDIYRTLRNNKCVEKEAFIEATKLDLEIKAFINLINPIIKTPQISLHTENLIKECIDKLNRLLMYVEKIKR